MQIIPRSQATTTAWSGGTTTEFYLDPADGSYAKRQFTLRISSATMDLPESDFTLLPDYLRIITPLSGGFTLTYQENPAGTVTLKPLEEAYFDGAWHTHSVGKALDFNVMYKKGLTAQYTLLAGSHTLTPAPRSYVYLPPQADPEKALGVLCGKVLTADTLYVLEAEDGAAALTLASGVQAIYITVQ